MGPVGHDLLTSGHELLTRGQDLVDQWVMIC